MEKPSDSLKDIQILGKSTRYQVVRADVSDLRGWMQDGPVCPLLAQHQISHCGIMKAAASFEIVRTNQSGTFRLACLDGEGVITDDKVEVIARAVGFESAFTFSNTFSPAAAWKTASRNNSLTCLPTAPPPRRWRATRCAFGFPPSLIC